MMKLAFTRIHERDLPKKDYVSLPNVGKLCLESCVHFAGIFLPLHWHYAYLQSTLRVLLKLYQGCSSRNSVNTHDMSQARWTRTIQCGQGEMYTGTTGPSSGQRSTPSLGICIIKEITPKHFNVHVLFRSHLQIYILINLPACALYRAEQENIFSKFTSPAQLPFTCICICYLMAEKF